jgi:DNA-directed RNA polymerase specialized sigma24 family protein
MSCLAKQDQTIVWPQVEAILPAVWTLCTQANLHPLLEARRTFMTALSKITVPTDAVTPMPGTASVQVAEQQIPLWQAYERIANSYRQHVSQASSAWEFWFLFAPAVQLRQYYGYTLFRDGFDVTQGHWLPGYFPLTAEARVAHEMTRHHYEMYDGLLRTGLPILLGLQKQAPLPIAVKAAAHAMREEELTSIARTLQWLSTLPPSPVQRWALGALVSWAKVQIQVRGYPSMRKALAEQQFTHKWFLEFLIDRAWQAPQEGVDTPQKLVAFLRRDTNALRRTGRRRGRPRGQSSLRPQVTSAPRALDQADYQVWQARDRAQRSVDHGLRDDISVGLQERRVWELHLQGYNGPEIAKELGISSSNVRNHLWHVRQKQQTGKRPRKKRPS